METYKVETTIRKQGNSFYSLIPPQIVKKLELQNDKKCNAEYSKFRDVNKLLCKKSSELGFDVILTTHDKDYIGVIKEIGDFSVTVFNKKSKENFIIPYTEISELNLQGGNK